MAFRHRPDRRSLSRIQEDQETERRVRRAIVYWRHNPGFSAYEIEKSYSISRNQLKVYGGNRLTYDSQGHLTPTRFDRSAIHMNVPTNAGIKYLRLQDSRTRSHVAQHFSLIKKYIHASPHDRPSIERALRKSASRSIKSGGLTYHLISNGGDIFDLLHQGELELEPYPE